MFSKRQKPYDEAVPPARRLSANIRNLYASNITSGRRAQTLINDANSAGVEHLPAPVRDPDNKNLARSMRRSFVKYSKWPSEYEAKIRVLDIRTQVEKEDKVALMLPHEVLQM